MSIDEFKVDVKLLAQNDANLPVLEKVMANFYSDIGIPIVEISHPFLSRVRYNDNDGDKFNLYNCKRDISYNPNPKKIFLQRANLPGEQVLYASVPIENNTQIAWRTALMEVGLENVKDESRFCEYFTVTKWAITRPLHLVILPFSKLSNLKNSDMARAAETHRNLVLEYFQSNNLINPHSHLRALEFISDCFCERNDKEVYYRITSTYCSLVRKWVRHNNMPFDGFMYPSANTEADGVNVALNKELADDGTLLFDYVNITKMIRYPSDPKQLLICLGGSEAFPDKDGNFSINALF